MTRPTPPPPIPGMPDLGSIGLDLPSSDAALCYELYPSPEAVGAFSFFLVCGRMRRA